VRNPTLRIGFLGTVTSDDPNYGGSGFTDYAADKFQDFSLAQGNTSDWHTVSFTYTNAALGKYPFIQLSNYAGGKIYVDDATMYEVDTTSSVLSAATGTFSTSVDLSKINYQAITKVGDGSLTVDSSGNLYPTAGLGLGGSLGLSDHRMGNGYFSTLDNSGDLSVGGKGTLANLSISQNATISGVLNVSGNTTFSGTTTLNPGFTTGSVIFQSSTGLAQNNSNFFWDNTNNRLGIGTTSPLATEDVNGTIRFGSYTKATLPSAGVKGRLARVTDDIQGIWMDNGSSWNPVTDYADASQFSGADIGAQINAAISAVSSGGKVYVPSTLSGSFSTQILINKSVTIEVTVQIHGHSNGDRRSFRHS